MSDKDGMLMNEITIEGIPNSGKAPKIILTRTLRRSKLPKDNAQDFQIMLKLRENRIRINRLANEFFSEDFEKDLELIQDDEFMENIKDIDGILYNMQRDLKNIRK